jgi:hypothetical protein
VEEIFMLILMQGWMSFNIRLKAMEVGVKETIVRGQ